MSSLFAILLYLAFLVLLLGVGYKVYDFARTPAPLKIPVAPAPPTPAGVVLRMGREVVFFESLFRSNLWTWVLGWLFHLSLVLVLVRHLRYFIEPVWFWVALAQPFGLYASLAMIAALAGLLARRLFVERIRYISVPSDHLMLVLLLLISLSGALMSFITHTDVIGAKAFMLGLMRFDWQPLPSDAVLYLHLLLAALLLLVFPFSKLLHAPGIFFSPTRNQTDNPREKRLLASWAAKLESGKNG
jgi:nitrate reductase gamma subunit